jgi:glycosyltransferase involved in cell wall biosynthesis
MSDLETLEHARKSGVSVAAIICTRGRPELLRRALHSIVTQSHPPDEILVIENAPEDDALRTLEQEFPQARHVVEPVLGLDFARNRALHEARSDIVAFLDDDAVADHDWLRSLVAPFSATSVAACTGSILPLSLKTAGQRVFEANGGLFARGSKPLRLPRDVRERRLHGRRAPLIAWAVSAGSGCNLAVRRDVALWLGGFDEALDLGSVLPGGGDNDMVWRVLESGAEVVYEPRARVRHEHRRELERAFDQIVGHQRALIALLTKAARHARGRQRLEVLAFLAWRLCKPGVRLARRLTGRDPLPAGVLLRMWRACWGALPAYGAARSLAAERVRGASRRAGERR